MIENTSDNPQENTEESTPDTASDEQPAAVEVRYKPDNTFDKKVNIYLSLFIVAAVTTWLFVWMNDSKSSRPGRALEVPTSWGEEIQGLKETIKEKLKDL